MAAEEVFLVPILSRMAIIIMQMLRQALPQIIVHLRPMRSRAKAGNVFPTMNINSTKPAIRREVLRGVPTFSTRTDGM